MRTLLRVILPVAVIVALIGGLSYFLQYTPPAPPKPEPANADLTDASLVIPERIATWFPDDPAYAPEFEKGGHGHFDFWLANTGKTPVAVIHRHRSCTCSTVELGDLAPAAAVESVRALAVLNTLHALTPGSFNLSALPVAVMREKMQWRALNLDDAPVYVEPADAAAGLRLGIVRIKWDAKNMGPQRIQATINYIGADKKAAEMIFEVPLVVVPPVQIQPPMIEFGTLRTGESRSGDLIVWTSTRDTCPLAMPNLSNYPTIVLGEPRPLSPTEDLSQLHPNQPRTRIRQGFRIPLTVNERLGNDQLDLGPLMKRIVFNIDTEFEAATTLMGTVRGDLRVGSKEGEDAIALGEFRYDQPHKKSVLVSGANPDLKLTLVSATPESMKVNLVQRSPGVWEVRIDVPAGAIEGLVPLGSAIVLQAGGPDGRKIRIPVTGSGLVQ